jgi:uncharacterized phiE125 gp8 family phage protein
MITRTTFPGKFVAVPFATSTLTGTLASGSAVVTALASTAALLPGMTLSGVGVPAGAAVLAVDSATQVTLNAAATASGPASLQFVTAAGPYARQTGTLATGSAVVTGLLDTAQLEGALAVAGTGVPRRTLVASIDSPTQVTLTNQATATGGQSLTFGLEPVMLDEAKNHLRVDYDYDDWKIARLIAAARRRCEGELDRAFLNTAFDYVLEAFPSFEVRDDPAIWRRVTNPLVIPKAPLVSVNSLTYVTGGGTAVSLAQNADYLVRTGEPGALYPYPVTAIWPYTRVQFDAVTVRCVVGHGTTAAAVPENVAEAILLLVGSLYENREATGDARNAELPMGVEYLLAQSSWGSRP